MNYWWLVLAIVVLTLVLSWLIDRYKRL